MASMNLKTSGGPKKPNLLFEIKMRTYFLWIRSQVTEVAPISADSHTFTEYRTDFSRFAHIHRKSHLFQQIRSHSQNAAPISADSHTFKE